MNIRTRFATFVGRSSRAVLRRISNGGTSLPGKLATRIQPDILKELAKDYEVILVTGTNGKTVTTALATNVLRQKFDHVMTNDTGSNLIQGIITAFIQDSKNRRKTKGKQKIAVLEVDEASVRHVTEHIKPKAILTTNLFMDQVDRFSDVTVTYDYILEGVAKTPHSVLLMNGDLPILADERLTNPREYFGFANDSREETVDIVAAGESAACPKCGTPLHYYATTYNNLGDYACPNCGFSRPDLTYQVDNILNTTPTSAQFILDGFTYSTPLAGLYNIYNALAAYVIGRFMGVTQEQIAAGLSETKAVFGRQEQIMVDGKATQINVIKNAVGLNQIIDLIALEHEPFTIIHVLNNNPADGRDVTWIREGQFEKFKEMPIAKTYVGGLAKEPLVEQLMAVHGQPEDFHLLEDAEAVIEAIQQAPTDKVYILASYTAMMGIREALAEQGYVKERMQAE